MNCRGGGADGCCWVNVCGGGADGCGVGASRGAAFARGFCAGAVDARDVEINIADRAADRLQIDSVILDDRLAPRLGRATAEV